MEEKYIAKDFIQEKLIDALEPIVKDRPYLSAALLALAIEVLGKSINQNTGWHDPGHSKEDFSKAINTFKSLEKYKAFNDKKNDKNGHQKNNKNPNDLYSCLRCGLLHAFLIDGDISLAPDKNNLTDNVIGCQDLYNDIKAAWDDILSEKVIASAKLYDEVICIVGNITGSTPYNITMPL